MNEFKELAKALISSFLNYIGTFTLLATMAVCCDEEITVFSFLIIFVVSFFVAFWLVPETENYKEVPAKATKENEVKVDDTEDDDYYNSLGL